MSFQPTVDLARALAITVLALIPASLVTATSASAVLPDLVADRPGTPYLDTDSSYYGESRLLLRFDGYVHNRGPGALEIRGSRGSSEPTHLMTSAYQRIFDSSGSFDDETLPDSTIKFETNDFHNHWHFMAAARYSVWKGDQSVQVAPAHKVGFCLLDGDDVEQIAQKRYTDPCRMGAFDATSVSMGLAPGWRDVYDAETALQWVDVSNVSPGGYRVSSEVDPDDQIREQSESNPRNWASTGSVIPGFLARSPARSEVLASGGQVTLAATTYGNPAAGAPQFKIVEGPEHGTLDRGTGGSWFSNPNVNYRPDLGYHGPDDFKFVARDSGSGFPFSPPSAAATIQVGEAPRQTAVAISGAPSQIYAGTSAQLSASAVDGPSSHVTWKVDGVAGGTSALGLISASGLYTAPAAPPPGGTVRVSATSVDGITDSARISILPRPRPIPAPSVETPVRAGALSALAVRRHGRRLVAKMVPGHSGRLKIVIRRRGKRVAARRINVTRGRPVTARFQLPRSYRGHRPRLLTVTAALRSRGKIVAVRRAQVR